MEEYTVLKRMADAIYGEVLLCRDIYTNDLVAVKKVSMTRAASGRAAGHTHNVHENVLQELNVNQRLQSVGGHPYVCRLRSDFYFDEGNERMLAMVFDYCPYGELLTALSDLKCFTEMQAMRYVSQIAQAIDFLHMQHIAHRDISLENILLDSSHRVQLCDFGLSCDSHSMTNEPVGKILYMAPEVLAGHHYSPTQADMWSLGIALFTMLVGHYPFHEASMYDPFYSIYARMGLSALLKKHNVNHVTFEMQSFLSGLLALDPHQRKSVRQVLMHALIQPYLEKDEDTTSFSTVSLEDEFLGNGPIAASASLDCHNQTTSLSIRPTTSHHVQDTDRLLSSPRAKSPQPHHEGKSHKKTLRSYFKQKFSHFRKRWNKIIVADPTEIMRKDVLQGMVVEAHHRGLKHAAECHALSFNDIVNLPIMQISSGSKTWELDGLVAETLLTDLFELDRRLLGRRACISIITKSRVMIVVRIERKMLLYVCPGKIKVVKGLDELVQKVAEESREADVEYVLRVLFQKEPCDTEVKLPINSVNECMPTIQFQHQEPPSHYEDAKKSPALASPTHEYQTRAENDKCQSNDSPQVHQTEHEILPNDSGGTHVECATHLENTLQHSIEKSNNEDEIATHEPAYENPAKSFESHTSEIPESSAPDVIKVNETCVTSERVSPEILDVLTDTTEPIQENQSAECQNDSQEKKENTTIHGATSRDIDDTPQLGLNKGKDVSSTSTQASMPTTWSIAPVDIKAVVIKATRQLPKNIEYKSKLGQSVWWKLDYEAQNLSKAATHGKNITRASIDLGLFKEHPRQARKESKRAIHNQTNETNRPELDAFLPLPSSSIEMENVARTKNSMNENASDGILPVAKDSFSDMQSIDEVACGPSKVDSVSKNFENESIPNKSTSLDESTSSSGELPRSSMRSDTWKYEDQQGVNPGHSTDDLEHVRQSISELHPVQESPIPMASLKSINDGSRRYSGLISMEESPTNMENELNHRHSSWSALVNKSIGGDDNVSDDLGSHRASYSETTTAFVKKSLTSINSPTGSSQNLMRSVSSDRGSAINASSDQELEEFESLPHLSHSQESDQFRNSRSLENISPVLSSRPETTKSRSPLHGSPLNKDVASVEQPCENETAVLEGKYASNLDRDIREKQEAPKSVDLLPNLDKYLKMDLNLVLEETPRHVTESTIHSVKPSKLASNVKPRGMDVYLKSLSSTPRKEAENVLSNVSDTMRVSSIPPMEPPNESVPFISIAKAELKPFSLSSPEEKKVSMAHDTSKISPKTSPRKHSPPLSPEIVSGKSATHIRPSNSVAFVADSPPPSPPSSPPLPSPQKMAASHLFVNLIDSPHDRTKKLMELREKKLKQLQDRKDKIKKKEINPIKELKPISNRQLIQNAIETNLLAGTACENERIKILEILNKNKNENFIIIFKGNIQNMKLIFKGLYTFEKEIIIKIYGQGPNELNLKMVKQFYRYNSGKKTFLPVDTKSFTIKTDGAALNDDCFKKKNMIFYN